MFSRFIAWVSTCVREQHTHTHTSTHPHTQVLSLAHTQVLTHTKNLENMLGEWRGLRWWNNNMYVSNTHTHTHKYSLTLAHTRKLEARHRRHVRTMLVHTFPGTQIHTHAQSKKMNMKTMWKLLFFIFKNFFFTHAHARRLEARQRRLVRTTMRC